MTTKRSPFLRFLSLFRGWSDHFESLADGRVIISYRKNHNGYLEALVEGWPSEGVPKPGSYKIAPALAGLPLCKSDAPSIRDTTIDKLLDAKISSSFSISAWEMRAFKSITKGNENVIISLNQDHTYDLVITDGPGRGWAQICLQKQEFSGSECVIKFSGKLIRALPLLPYSVKVLKNKICMFETGDEDFVIYTKGAISQSL